MRATSSAISRLVLDSVPSGNSPASRSVRTRQSGRIESAADAERQTITHERQRWSSTTTTVKTIGQYHLARAGIVIGCGCSGGGAWLRKVSG